MLLSFTLFLLVSIFCFTIPGIFLIIKSKLQTNFWEKIILGTTLGFTFFTLISYFLLVMKLSLLLLPIIVVIILISFKQILSLKGEFSLLPKRKLILISIIFLFGVTGQLLIIAPSGIYQNGDLVFWSSHGHDGLWHISLMEEYKKGYPLQNPAFAGERLVNYHFFSDIAPAEFNRYFKIPPLDLYFRFFPLFFSILLGSLAYLLGKKMGGSFASGLWSTFFTYFAGSFGYIIGGGESIFWASQPQSSIGNPPQIAAFVIILAFLYLFIIFLDNRGKMLLFLCALLAGSLAGFKIYGAVVLLISLFLVGAWQAVESRKIHILGIFFISSILATITYFPNASNAGSFLIFEPWWFIRTMVVAPDRLNWLDLELKRQTYIFENNWKRVAQVELTAFVIFFFGNLGMRFLGLGGFWKMMRSFFTNYFNQLFIIIIIISFILPLLFLQKGVATNTIQFLQYFLLLFGILAGLAVAGILKKIKSQFATILIGLTIILLSVPTQLLLIISFYNRSPFAKITSAELSALKFLKENVSQNSVIITPPYNKYLELKDLIPNIWDWSDTSYVSALSNKRLYLADTEQVTIMGYKLDQRLSLQENVFTQNDPIEFSKKLQENQIDYLYFPKPLKPALDLNETSLTKVYTNDAVEIWHVYTKENRPE